MLTTCLLFIEGKDKLPAGYCVSILCYLSRRGSIRLALGVYDLPCGRAITSTSTIVPYNIYWLFAEKYLSVRRLLGTGGKRKTWPVETGGRGGLAPRQATMLPRPVKLFGGVWGDDIDRRPFSPPIGLLIRRDSGHASALAAGGSLPLNVEREKKRVPRSRCMK